MDREHSSIRGYSLVLHSAITYIFAGGFGTSALNVIVPIFAEKTGIEKSVLLNMNTFAALAIIPSMFIMGRLVLKYGVRIVTAMSFIFAGIFGSMLLGFVSNVTGYLICMIVLQLSLCGYSMGTTSTLISTWFPRKRGVVMGFTTLGMPLSSVVFLPIFTGIIDAYGFNRSMIIIGLVLVFLGIISWFWIRNTPEELGLKPDLGLVTYETVLNEKAKLGVGLGKESKYSFRNIIRMKQFWLISISFGIFSLVTSAFMSQIVPCLGELGIDGNKAVRLVSILSILSLFASVISGFLDTKFGTKRATIIYGIWTILAFVFFYLGKNNTFMLGASVLMICGLSGCTANLQPSLIVEVFGDKNFTNVNSYVGPINYGLRSFAFSIIALGVSKLGSYYLTYTMLGALVIIAVILTIFINQVKND